MSDPSPFFTRVFGDDPPVRLFEEDQDLFADLPHEGRLEARAGAIAPTLRLPRGRWEAQLPGRCDPDGCLGLLVLDGLLVHSVQVANQPRSEVVGPGDVLRPWQQQEGLASVPFSSHWEVAHAARLAVLDARFLAFACRWPQLILAITARTVRRSHWLALHLAIADLRRVDERLMLFLWHLADRWGRVTPDGVLVPLPVTHDVLAQLVCAQRPTVTSALRRLTDAGRLRRRPDKTWILSPEAAPRLPSDASRRAA